MSYILSDQWGVGGLLQLDLKRAGSLFTEASASDFVSHTIFGPVAGLFDFYGQRGTHVLAVNLVLISNERLVFKATSDLQFDLGLNVGLIGAADNFNP